MTVPIPRERLEAFGRKLAELRRREERILQSQRGWYDEDGVRHGGLMSFIRYYWKVLEPENKLIEGWMLYAIVEHLEAVTFGEIKRLLMTVVPGGMKSLCTDVFWPAWEWGPMGQSHLRYVTFSYSASLTERDNERFRDLIIHPSYTSMWRTFTAVKIGATKVTNTSKGWKLASSVGGVGTGERGDRIICFPWDTLVATDKGPTKIGELVAGLAAVRVWSYSQERHQYELKPVVGWHRNPSGPIVTVQLSDGSSFNCTADHRILTAGGYVEAQSLNVGTPVCAAPSGMLVAASNVGISQIKVQVTPDAPPTYASDSIGGDAKSFRNNLGCFVMTCRDLAHQFFSQVRRAIAKIPMPLAISNILGASAVFQVFQSGAPTVSVPMSRLLSFRARTDKREHYETMAHDIDRASITPQCDARIALDQYSAHDPFLESISATEPPARQTLNATDVGDGISWEAGNIAPAFVSAVLRHEEIPSSTYCLTVADNGNMCIVAGTQSIVCSNCDDPHNIKEAESEIIRKETVRWFREAMSDRLNSLQTGVIVVIMQRAHEEDVAGTILELELPYVHLMIPMEYEWGRQVDDTGAAFTTPIGWADPRYIQGKPSECEGALAWPERFPAEEVAAIKKVKGPYGYATQYQQSPSPRGGGIFQRLWWQLYEAPDGKFPTFDYLIASLDSAFTAKEENDPSGFTVWGVFSQPSFEAGRVDEKAGHIWQVSGPKQRRIMLVHAWRKHLAFSADRSLIETRANESHQLWRRRTQEHWGLIEWVHDTCTRFKVDKLLIEAKASGISAAQELQNRFGRQNWAVQLCPVSGDKVARALACQPTFSQGLVYAPARDWAEMTIDECATFPRGRYDDLTDSMTQAISFLRTSGLAQSDDETMADEADRVRHRPQLKAVYPV